MEFFNGNPNAEQADAEVRSRTFEEIIADCPEPLRSQMLADHAEEQRKALPDEDAAKWSRMKWGYSRATDANR